MVVAKSGDNFEEKMDQFLTFARYQELGGTLLESDFIQYELLARVKINQLTNNQLLKLEDDNPIWENIEILVFTIIRRELLGKLDGKDTTSESAGRLSVTWKDKDGKEDELIKSFLPQFVGGGIIQVGILRT